ncbi:DUF4097 family beta strand repeat-containing protein [Olivibacter sitiensis]|uniref:DUF4097 family beta strand repeat-containing protein n=1 Tax=Olivibacter sitiensis TaxID=376470 RepID=UPI000424DB86|nr:DUF4097 family beta strand repeat-containing protein [Olivibacter sitiensis]
MKHQLTLFLLFFLGWNITTYGQHNYTLKNLSRDNITSLSVQTSGGSISVVGVPQSEAHIEMIVQPNGNKYKNLSKEEIDQLLEKDFDIVTELGGKHLNVSAKPKKKTNWNSPISISFKAYVPKNVSSELKTSGGSIRLENLTGKQNFATSGGSIRISLVDGELNGRTSGGSIHISDSKNSAVLLTSGGSIQAENHVGNLRLSTSGGSIKLSNLDGSIEAKTSGGSITATDISGDLLASTSGGSVRVSKMSGNLEASTSAGGVDVSMIQVDKYIKLSTSAGAVNLNLPSGANKLDLDLKGNRVNIPTITGFNGSSSKSRVQGSTNGGGTLISASTSVGSVNLSFN